jgi:hypothetical protein
LEFKPVGPQNQWVDTMFLTTNCNSILMLPFVSRLNTRFIHPCISSNLTIWARHLGKICHREGRSNVGCVICSGYFHSLFMGTLDLFPFPISLPSAYISFHSFNTNPMGILLTTL